MLDDKRRVDAEDLDRCLPALAARPDVAPRRAPRSAVGEDGLLALSPRVYVEHLTGRRVGRSGKVRCPFHDDAKPSLHVYETAAEGWYCFGCGRGGSIYDFAALLLDRGTRGEEFIALRRELAAILG